MIKRLIPFIILVLVNLSITAQNDSINNKLLFGFVIGNDMTFNIIEKNNYTNSVNPRYGLQLGFLVNKQLSKSIDFETGLFYCLLEKKYKSDDFIMPDPLNPLYSSFYNQSNSQTIYYPLYSGTTYITSLLLMFSPVYHFRKINIYLSPSLIMNFWVRTKTYIDNSSVDGNTFVYDITNISKNDTYKNHFKIAGGLRIGIEQKLKKMVLKYEPNFVFWNLINFGPYQKNTYFYSIGLNIILMMKK